MDITHGRREERHSFVMKEHMFDKVVTPSDVGKLNRLVIPKQHAQKHLPLATSGDHDKGLLLSFEGVVSGKSWRFRYSYWSSSQSYVITKGWSRFVKEKGLGAGDTVSFARGVGEASRHRLYIDWKRRPDSASCGGNGVGSCHGGQLLHLRLPCAPPRPAKRLRLFGVNLDMPDHSGGGGCANYRWVAHAVALLQLPSVTGETPACAMSNETQATLDLCL